MAAAPRTNARKTGEVTQLLEALERKSCVLVGHDWGANVAWNFAAHYPEMVEKLVILNVPHPKGFLKNMSFAQFKKSWYIFFFQVRTEGRNEFDGCVMVV